MSYYPYIMSLMASNSLEVRLGGGVGDETGSLGHSSDGVQVLVFILIFELIANNLHIIYFVSVQNKFVLLKWSWASKTGVFGSAGSESTRHMPCSIGN